MKKKDEVTGIKTVFWDVALFKDSNNRYIARIRSRFCELKKLATKEQRDALSRCRQMYSKNVDELIFNCEGQD